MKWLLLVGCFAIGSAPKIALADGPGFAIKEVEKEKAKEEQEEEPERSRFYDEPLNANRTDRRGGGLWGKSHPKSPFGGSFFGPRTRSPFFAAKSAIRVKAQGKVTAAKR